MPAPACQGAPGCEEKLCNLQICCFPILFPVSSLQLPVCQSGILSNLSIGCPGISQLVIWDLRLGPGNRSARSHGVVPRRVPESIKIPACPPNKFEQTKASQS